MGARLGIRGRPFGNHLRWKLLTDGNNGIPRDHFVRVVPEYPGRDGLLYAGTEFGLYVSFDEGRHWQSLQQKMAVSPVTDLGCGRSSIRS